MFALTEKNSKICHGVFEDFMKDFFIKNFPIFDVKPVVGNFGTSTFTGKSGKRYSATKIYHDDEISGNESYMDISPHMGEIEKSDFEL